MEEPKVIKPIENLVNHLIVNFVNLDESLKLKIENTLDHMLK